MEIYKNCQSCGMPMKKDPQHGGTNSDGTKNVIYCSHCYRDGTFTRPGISITEMKSIVKGKLKEMGFPGFIAGLFTMGIPKLKRWNN